MNNPSRLTICFTYNICGDSSGKLVGLNHIVFIHLNSATSTGILLS